MEPRLRREIERELESGEQILWAERPSLRQYVQRRLPLILALAGGAIALMVISGDAVQAALARDEQVRWIVGGIAAFSILAVLESLRVRRKTAYAITDRRLVRAGRKSILSNRPGQTFSYEPEDVRVLEVVDHALSRHVYVDAQRWGAGHKSVLIGFEDLRNPRAAREAIEAWLDAWQGRLLSGPAESRIVRNSDYGFQLAVPAAWKVEIGTGAETEPAGRSPSEWRELHAWTGEETAWDLLRATGPANATLAIEPVRAPGRPPDSGPRSDGVLSRFFDTEPETSETRIGGRPARQSTWVTGKMVRLIEVPCGPVEYRIHLVARTTTPRLMGALQNLAESFELLEAEMEAAAASDRR